MFITLAATKILFFIAIALCFCCYGNLKFPLTYNGEEMKIGIYCYLTADILEVFQKCLMRGPPPKIHFLSKPLNLISFHGNQKAKFAKILSFKIQLFGSYIGDKAETKSLQNFCCFIAIA